MIFCVLLSKYLLLYHLAEVFILSANKRKKRYRRMIKVLVTGANGMLASNLIDELLRKGYYVVGMVRRRSSYRGVQSENLELFEGDFKNPQHLESALQGCSGIFHVAAITDQSLLKYEEYEAVNSKPIATLMNVVVKSGVKRVVLVSTANTIGNGTWEQPANETKEWTAPLSQSFYARSKVDAEKIFKTYAHEVECITVNPTFMLGRFGTSAGSNQIFDMAHAVTFCPPGGKNFLDVEEAARGIVLAYERGKSGENYLICGENISFKDFFKRVKRVKFIIIVPTFLMLFFGLIGNLLRALGIKVAFSLPNMKILCMPDAYVGDKARRELGFDPRPIAIS